MGAVWTRVRAELRARRAATLAVAVLIGLGGGLVMTAAAGARRTDTAYPRFLRDHSAGDLLAATNVGGEDFSDGRQLTIDEFARMPAVQAVELLRFYVIRNPLAPIQDADAFFTVDARSPDREGPALDTFKLLEGRLPDPARPEEAVLTLLGAEKRGMRVGARFGLEGLPQVFPDFANAAKVKPMEIHIVGRVAAPGDFPPQSGDETIALHMTPAFYERYPERAFGFPGGAVLRLDDDPGAADRFRAGYAAAGGNAAFTIERAMQDANVQRSIMLQAVALWLLAALAAAAFVLVFGQTVSRQIHMEADEHPTLGALGMTRPQLIAVSLTRMLVAAAIGAAIATVLAVGLSPLFPAGLARIAEPSTGLAFDAVVAGLASAASIVAVAALAVWPAWRAARRVGRTDAGTSDRPSLFTELVARVGRLPALVAGARLALQRGRGRTAMPVRTTIAGLILGIGVLGAAGTFASSLDHFLSTPRLYGVTWDARIGIDHPGVFEGDKFVGTPLPDLAQIARRLVDVDDRVEGVSIGLTGYNIAVGDEEHGLLLETMMLEPVVGNAPMPPLLEGRYPRRRPQGSVQEVVLGRRATEALGASVGETIDAMFLDVGETVAPLRVVGVAVVPIFVDSSRLGESALLAPGAVPSGVEVPEDFSVPNNMFVSVSGEGAITDGGDVVAAIARIIGPGTVPGEHVHVWPDAPPTDVLNFGRVKEMPQALGLLLAIFAAATLAHTLVTAVRRRRRDLAILKTLGFVRRQVRVTVLVQSLILTGFALLVGIPLGLASGRWIWRVFATDLGVVPQPVLSGVTVASAAVAAIVLAASISVLPARAAARTQPAIILRSE